jgi:AcrR family transcriptional regulator
VFYNRPVEERARRIVETAVELAEQGGFEAVRLRDVAAHAGVALGTLYRRFRSKEELLLAALEQEIDDVRRRFEKRPPEGATPLERVTVFFQITTRALCRRPNLTRALVRSVATGEPELTQKVASFHTLMEELITAALRGERLSESESPSERERRIGFALQQVWFASLIGWSSGLHSQAAIVDQTASAADLLLSG